MSVICLHKCNTSCALPHKLPFTTITQQLFVKIQITYNCGFTPSYQAIFLPPRVSFDDIQLSQ